MRAAKVDANQKEIVKRFRDLGWSVAITSTLGAGFPDLLVGKAHPNLQYGKINLLIEVKDGSKPPSARKLTPFQEEWHKQWQGPVMVIESVEQVDDLDAEIRRLD